MYELVDFGDGRKLERFGPWLLDRPCPAAANKKLAATMWGQATARYAGSRAADGKWTPDIADWAAPETVWDVGLGNKHGFRLQLAPLPSGQVGVFPEQYANWQWITRQVRRAVQPVRVLNLFAYTGGSSLAAAVAGAEVTHVDAARSVVTRARANADLSGLADHPIRWIVEDARKFCEREVRRGNSYEAVILDPPTYGHGPQGETWSIGQDLLPLLELCGELTRPRRAFILGSCHSPGLGPAELSAYFSEALVGHCGQPPRTGALTLETTDRRRLSSGVYARWPG